MCGILGKIGDVDEARFVEALNLMTHRGPDASDMFHLGNVHLGHRRLSIIDLSETANQPMSYANHTHTIVYNGEVYNFLEIRARLEKEGYQFQTDGDTEVLLTAYVAWGESFLTELNGMFAFAIVEHATQDVFLARDRLGIKPLYFVEEEDTFAFASEPKSLIHLSDKRFTLNLDAVCSYLCFRYPVARQSFFEGIEALPPGFLMRVSGGNIVEKKQYWSLADVLEQPVIEDPAQAVDELKALFKSSIEYRMIADVPVGAYLSGGVDSSAIAALMSQMSTQPVRTFTIGFPEEGFNEFEYSRIVAEQYKTSHEEILIDAKKYMGTLKEMIEIKDAPLGVPNEVPLFLMSQALKKHITVVLSGEGADEIFGGYGRIFRSADDWPLLNEWKENGFETESELGQRLQERYGQCFESKLEHFFHLYRYTPMATMQTLIDQSHLDAFVEGPTMQTFSDTFGEVADEDFAIQMMYVFERLHLPGLLQRVDATTMGTSVEARVPFVDHRLVEFAFRLSKDLKLRWNDGPVSGMIGADISEVHDTPKWILKEAMSDVLPDEILYRRKVGFPVPLAKWVGSDIAETIREKVNGGRLMTAGILKSEGVEHLFSSETEKSKNAMLLWMLYNLEVFLELHPTVDIPNASSYGNEAVL
jgi:asparagine synthase (glutamine-hydrolysing)